MFGLPIKVTLFQLVYINFCQNLALILILYIGTKCTD